MRDETDTALMLRVKAGEPACLGELFERHSGRLYRYFYRLCGRRQWSEDMVQECFARMLRYASAYREDGHFLSWAFHIARNVAADFLRREDRGAGAEGEDPDALAGGEPGPADRRLLEAEQGRLQRALLRLAPEQRELILLGRLRELPGTELARLFGCSTGAVKVRQHRALKELREHFESETESESTSKR